MDPKGFDDVSGYRQVHICYFKPPKYMLLSCLVAPYIERVFLLISSIEQYMYDKGILYQLRKNTLDMLANVKCRYSVTRVLTPF